MAAAATMTLPNGFIPSGKAVLRTASDEAADRDEFVDNMTRGVYKEWPNEAGFDGLTEERGPIELTVIGKIPSWTVGSLYRTGPGACKVEDTPNGTHYVSHWFDGLAHAHKFEILPSSDESGVRVVYSSRKQSDKLVDSIKSYGPRNMYSFGQRRDPCVGLFGKIMSVFQPAPHEANVSVVINTNVPGLSCRDAARSVEDEKAKAKRALAPQGHRNNGVRSLWVTTDANPMLEVDPDTLEPIGIAHQTQLHPDLKGPGSCAHAQRDPKTGDMFNYNLAFGRVATYRVFRVNAKTGTTEILATICDPDVKAAYLHSFFLTDSFVVLRVHVAHYALNGLSVPWQRNLIDSIQEFDQQKRCKWLVVDRRGSRGLVATFETPAAFFFHSVNSFEEPAADGNGTDLFCDVIDYENQDMMRSLYYDILLDRDDAAKTFWAENDRMQTTHCQLARYRLRVPAASNNPQDAAAAGSAKRDAELVLSIPAPHAGELPTINPAYHCKRHRYVYSVTNRGRSTLLDSIVKTDVDTREALLWGCPHGHTPGEPIFVPRPAAAEEDDGVLLSVVLDGSTRRSYLLCLDARSLIELGRAEVPFAIGFGFHGAHAPTGNL